MTTMEQRLEQQIESALIDFLHSSEQAARNAMQRAFQSAGRQRSRTKTTASKPISAGKKRTRRSAGEVEALCQKLLLAVTAHPGETMGVLAEHAGESAGSLGAIVSRLKREDRIRTVGNRRHTRYFPATMTKSEA